jgi:hypothetical protein
MEFICIGLRRSFKLNAFVEVVSVNRLPGAVQSAPKLRLKAVGAYGTLLWKQCNGKRQSTLQEQSEN